MLTVLDRHIVGQFLRTRGVEAWGVAANDPRLPGAPALPRALSILMSIDPAIIRGMKHGPTEDYRDEYVRLNHSLDEATAALAGLLRDHGHEATAVPATGLEDDGFFPHKTAATSAGLGWIGKTALFVSPDLGPWVRLATVFTDADLPIGEPVTEGGCGGCRRCVDACPAGAGRDVRWRAGMRRDELLDVVACRHENDAHSGDAGGLCGICVAVCPFGRRSLRG